MNKLIVVAAGALAAIAVSLALNSTGVANASPDVSGKTLAEAWPILQQAGYTPVVSNAIGDQMSQSDCTVVRQQDSTPLPFGTKKYRLSQNTVLLTLRCLPSSTGH
jgi:hypothetical protein